MDRVITRHFFKTVLLFTGMIAVGLVAAFLISHFDIAKKAVNEEADVAAP